MNVEKTVKTVQTLGLTTSLATTPDIEIENFSSGTVFVPAGSPITAITWYGAPYAPDQPAGPGQPAAPTYLPLYDATLIGGTAQAQAVAAGHAVALPSALFGCASVKGVITGGTAGSVSVSLKS